MQIDSSAGLHNTVWRLRRGLRDVRDRMVRHKRSWRDVGFAGMASGDGVALVMVKHDGVDQCEVEAVLRRRWPEVVVNGLEQEQPAVTMLPDEAADLGQCRRGVEPLRIVIIPPHYQQVASPVIEPMPVVI